MYKWRSLDGYELEGENTLTDRKCNSLELYTKKYRVILIEALYISPKYVDEFYNVWIDLNCNRPKDIDIVKRATLVGILEWITGLLSLLKEVTKIDMIYSDYDTYTKEFKDSIVQVTEKLMEDNYEEALIFIKTVILGFVDRFEKQSKEYLSYLLKEEERKDLIN